MARRLARFMQDQRRHVGTFPWGTDWIKENRLLEEALLPVLGPVMLRMILASAADAADVLGAVPLPPMDPGLAIEAYALGQAQQINGATRARLGRATQRVYDTGDEDRYQADLLAAFGAVAAAALAVTATTGAYSNGSGIIAASMEQRGYIVETTWHAEPGACEICAPLNGTTQESGAWTQPPPAHAYCRCWISHTYREPEVVERNAPFTAQREALQAAMDKDRLYARSRELMAEWRKREGRAL